MLHLGKYCAAPQREGALTCASKSTPTSSAPDATSASAASRALAGRPDLAVERVWRPFQLQPDLPAGGLPWAAFATAKFGGAERAAAMFARVTEVAAGEGLDYRFDHVATAPNTAVALMAVVAACVAEGAPGAGTRP